jgi:hypothetical protein
MVLRITGRKAAGIHPDLSNCRRDALEALLDIEAHQRRLTDSSRTIVVGERNLAQEMASAAR